MECHKLNRAYTGLMVRKEGEMLTPTINLTQLYEAYKAQHGVTMETAVSYTHLSEDDRL